MKNGSATPSIWPKGDQQFVAEIREAAERYRSLMKTRAYSEIWFNLMTSTGRITTTAYAAESLLKKGIAAKLPKGITLELSGFRDL